MTTMNSNRVADMTIDELRALIRETVRDVIEEMTDDDPDVGLEFKPEVAERLQIALQEKRRGTPLADVIHELGLNHTSE